MDREERLAQEFGESKEHLKAVAYRILGSMSEADDAIQETWLKLKGSESRQIENLRGWLTTVLARVCFDMLRARRRSQRMAVGESGAASSDESPEDAAALADAIGLALLVVLEKMTPAERVAFVLHDMFEVSFEVIAAILARTPEATRQLATRARQRVRIVKPPATDPSRQRELVQAFLAASREGDFEGLLAVLSPAVVLHADPLAVRMAKARQGQGAPNLERVIRGRTGVANTLKGRAAAALPAIIDGEAGAVWTTEGQVRSAFVFTFQGGRITAINIVMEPDRLAELDVQIG